MAENESVGHAADIEHRKTTAIVPLLTCPKFTSFSKHVINLTARSFAEGLYNSNKKNPCMPCYGVQVAKAAALPTLLSRRKPSGLALMSV